jgi:hypothetical protein
LIYNGLMPACPVGQGTHISEDLFSFLFVPPHSGMWVSYGIH